MQELKVQTSYVNSWKDLNQFLQDSKIDIRGADIINESVMEIQYKDKKEATTQTDKTNVVLGAFVTCWARLELYNAMDQLQEKVLYFDTVCLKTYCFPFSKIYTIYSFNVFTRIPLYIYRLTEQICYLSVMVSVNLHRNYKKETT